MTDTKHHRPSWDEYFRAIAKLTSTRSVCFRNKVGAIVVRDNVIVSQGYNGAPKYQRNCAEIGFCYRDANGIQSGTRVEACRAAGCHAESNAVAMAARNGLPTLGATMYVYGHNAICNSCKAVIANAGIARVIYESDGGVVTGITPSVDWTTHPVDQ